MSGECRRVVVAGGVSRFVTVMDLVLSGLTFYAIYITMK